MTGHRQDNSAHGAVFEIVSRTGHVLRTGRTGQTTASRGAEGEAAGYRLLGPCSPGNRTTGQDKGVSIGCPVSCSLFPEGTGEVVPGADADPMVLRAGAPPHEAAELAGGEVTPELLATARAFKPWLIAWLSWDEQAARDALDVVLECLDRVCTDLEGFDRDQRRADLEEAINVAAHRRDRNAFGAALAAYFEHCLKAFGAGPEASR
jgi:hypothetical protein